MKYEGIVEKEYLVSFYQLQHAGRKKYTNSCQACAFPGRYNLNDQCPVPANYDTSSTGFMPYK